MGNKTLKDLKVGDKVWTIQNGLTHLTENTKSDTYPLDINGYTYTADGRYLTRDSYPSLYLTNPFEKKVEGKYMMVSTDGEYWNKRFVIISENEKVFVESEWEFYKEIEPEETLPKAIAEISLEQIAEKFGVDVEQIRIKP